MIIQFKHSLTDYFWIDYLNSKHDIYFNIFAAFDTQLRDTTMANRDRVRQMDKQELGMYLMEQLGDEVADQTLKKIEEEKINGKAFLTLNDQDLHELNPSMGERKLVKLHLDSLKSSPTTVSASSLS